MQEKFALSEKRSKNQIKYQRKFLKIIKLCHRYFAVVFFVFIFRTAVENIVNTASFGVLYYYVIIAKLIIYIAFIYGDQSCIMRSFINYYEFMLACYYLKNRIDDCLDQIFQMLSDSKLDDPRYCHKRILNLTTNYNSILKIQQHMNRHFATTMMFLSCSIVILIFYPALILFDANRTKLMAFFYSTNYLFIVSTFVVVFHFNTMFLLAVSRLFLVISRALKLSFNLFFFFFFRTINF